MSTWVLASVSATEPYVPPSAADFEFPPMFSIGEFGVTKPMVMIFFSVALIGIFFIVAARRAQMVPGRWQFAAEEVYAFVRNGIARDNIGAHDFAKFVPLLVSLFAFVYLNNLFGIVPLIQFPTMSRIGYPIALAIIVWVVWNYIGLKKHGALGYLKHVSIIPGIPKASLLLVAPLEFFSTIFVRPLSHALRLFANMFAGHLLLLVFILGAEYMFFESGSPIQMVLAPFAAGMAIVMTLFEALIQLIQAYIFTLLAALYIAGALAEDH